MPKSVLRYVVDKVRLRTGNTAFQFSFPPLKAKGQRVKEFYSDNRIFIEIDVQMQTFDN